MHNDIVRNNTREKAWQSGAETMDDTWIQVAALLLLIGGVGALAFAAVRMLARQGVRIGEDGVTSGQVHGAD